MDGIDVPEVDAPRADLRKPDRLDEEIPLADMHPADMPPTSSGGRVMMKRSASPSAVSCTGRLPSVRARTRAPHSSRSSAAAARSKAKPIGSERRNRTSRANRAPTASMHRSAYVYVLMPRVTCSETLSDVSASWTTPRGMYRTSPARNTNSSVGLPGSGPGNG